MEAVPCSITCATTFELHRMIESPSYTRYYTLQIVAELRKRKHKRMSVKNRREPGTGAEHLKFTARNKSCL